MSADGNLDVKQISDLDSVPYLYAPVGQELYLRLAFGSSAREKVSTETQY
jgi:hypothetical protein